MVKRRPLPVRVAGIGRSTTALGWGFASRMQPLRLLSAAQQVALHLRQELERGRWVGSLPGVESLAAELGVNHKTVAAALRQLEREGQLAGSGAGRRRRIITLKGRAARPMRIALLEYEPAAHRVGYVNSAIRYKQRVILHSLARRASWSWAWMSPASADWSNKPRRMPG